MAGERKINRNAEIMKAYAQQRLTSVEIAPMFNISDARVRQIVAAECKRLKLGSPKWHEPSKRRDA